MVQMTRAALQREIDLLFQINTSGDIEADEVDKVLTDFSDSVTFLSPPTAPFVVSFTIQDQGADVDAGFNFQGTKTFLYNIHNPGDVEGNVTIDQAGSNLSTTVDPSGTSVSLTVNAVTFTAGQSVVFTLSGTDKNTDPFSKTFTITARTDDDYLYYGSQTSATAGDFVFGNEQRTPLTTENQTFSLPVFTGSEYIVIAQPAASNDFSEIVIDSVNQVGAFTKNSAAVTINSVSYDVWITNRDQLGTQLSNEQVTVVR